MARDGHRATRRIARLAPLMQRVGRALQSRVSVHVGVADVSFSQWNALNCLDQMGTPTLRALALDLAVTLDTAKRIAAGLEARGLVEQGGKSRSRDALQLTPSGHAKLREAAPEIDLRLADVVATLGDREIDILITLLGRLAYCFDTCARPDACDRTEA
jgi:DNA-binding MarR family transcriptional regulator